MHSLEKREISLNINFGVGLGVGVGGRGEIQGVLCTVDNYQGGSDVGNVLEIIYTLHVFYMRVS